jgi:hypothetical protein
MPNRELITEKLIKMEEYLDQLQKFTPASYEDYLHDLVPNMLWNDYCN